MPELAEVEYYRKQWKAGRGGVVKAVSLHGAKRIFRGVNLRQIRQGLDGARLARTFSHGKQLLFEFSGGSWLGIHLGMTGRLLRERSGFRAGRHDHLVLRQAAGALVFRDPRLFGRVRFDRGRERPEWWAALGPDLVERPMTATRLGQMSKRHRRVSIKGVLLQQRYFPGVGNWMADEILWQARIYPGVAAGKLSARQRAVLSKSLATVCAGALATVGVDFSDPPSGWLFHERWSARGKCPRDGAGLSRAAVAGRTTAWCARCQAGVGK